jgi:uncharacterized protein
MNQNSISENLDQLGFTKGNIIEIILTTFNPNGTINAAPMGVIRDQTNNVIIKPYKSSNTYRNLEKSKRACINTTNKPELFFVTAFKEINSNLFPQPTYQHLAIKEADASIQIEIIKEEEVNSERPSFFGKIASINISNLFPLAFSRGRSEAIEAIIQATHFEYQAKMNKPLDEDQIKQLNRSKEVIKSVSQINSTESIVVKEIEKLLFNWRNIK